MGIASIDDVTDKVQNEKLRECLRTCRDKHVTLQDEIRSLLGEYHDEGKEPNPMAKSMSWMKTNVKIAMDESDHTIADLMTDGCNMGIKSLRKYLNQYEAASEKAKDIAKRLINLEEKLVTDIKEYL
jgi:hypothetical protein